MRRAADSSNSESRYLPLYSDQSPPAAWAETLTSTTASVSSSGQSTRPTGVPALRCGKSQLDRHRHSRDRTPSPQLHRPVVGPCGDEAGTRRSLRAISGLACAEPSDLPNGDGSMHGAQRDPSLSPGAGATFGPLPQMVAEQAPAPPLPRPSVRSRSILRPHPVDSRSILRQLAVAFPTNRDKLKGGHATCGAEGYRWPHSAAPGLRARGRRPAWP